eukprot:8862610-Heterocapsa_arctica.AAC.1
MPVNARVSFVYASWAPSPEELCACEDPCGSEGVGGGAFSFRKDLIEGSASGPWYSMSSSGYAREMILE